MSNDPCLMFESTRTALKLHFPQVSMHPPIIESYRRGIAFLRAFYGEQVVLAFYRHLWTGNLRECLRCLTTLARLYPARLASPGTKLIKRLVERYKLPP